jgi:hypothetical protein
MDRTVRAVTRLWGATGNGTLPPTARFADELQNLCKDDLTLKAPSVSKWSYGDQLEHLYLSSHYVLDRLEEALGKENSAEHMGFWGVGLIVGGFIPRHAFPTIPPLEPRGGTMAEIEPLQQMLHDRLRRIDWGLSEVKASPGKSRHPRMKWLNSSQWMFFADIHHRHHLAIMRDMRKAVRA